MTWTVLHGLDDEDIPEAFTDELVIAAGDEVMARPVVLLNALLLAGWEPPSKASAPVDEETLGKAAKVLSDAWTDAWAQESEAWMRLAQALADRGLLRNAL